MNDLKSYVKIFIFILGFILIVSFLGIGTYSLINQLAYYGWLFVGAVISAFGTALFLIDD